MKLAYADVLEVAEMVKKIAGADLPLPPKIAIQLRKLGKKIGDEITSYDPERQKILEKYKKGTENLPNGMVKFILPKPKSEDYEGDENWPEFVKEWNELISIPVEIPWENADVDDVEKRISEDKGTVKMADVSFLLNLLESLNKANEQLAEKEKTDVPE